MISDKQLEKFKQDPVWRYIKMKIRREWIPTIESNIQVAPKDTATFLMPNAEIKIVRGLEYWQGKLEEVQDFLDIPAKVEEDIEIYKREQKRKQKEKDS